VRGEKELSEDGIDVDDEEALLKVWKWRKMKKWGWGGKPGIYQAYDVWAQYADYPEGLVSDPITKKDALRRVKSYDKALWKSDDGEQLEWMFKAVRTKADAKKFQCPRIEYYALSSDMKFIYLESFGSDGNTPISAGATEED